MRVCSQGQVFGYRLDSIPNRARAAVREDHDIVVIGAGQAGLAMSAVLQQHGREHVVLERGRIGGRWRTERWDSLRFQFPNWSLEMPGYAYSGEDPDGFAHWREILELIEDYATTILAPVHQHTEVTGLVADDGGLVLSTSTGTIRARHVVVATGPFQRPCIPQFSRDLARSVLQIDPTRYRRPEDLPDGAVVVVGSGASGCQIADELLRAGRTVYLSVSSHRRVPRRVRGTDVYWWLERMGRFEQTIDNFHYQKWPPGIVLTGVSGGYDVDVRKMAAAGVRVLGRILGASDHRLAVARTVNEALAEADATSMGSSPPHASSLPRTGTWSSPRRSRASPKTRLPPSPRSRRWTSGARTSPQSFGQLATSTTTAGCKSRCWTPRAGRSSSAGSARCQGFTSSACTGCTPSSQACSPVSATTRNTSPSRSISRQNELTARVTKRRMSETCSGRTTCITSHRTRAPQRAELRCRAVLTASWALPRQTMAAR